MIDPYRLSDLLQETANVVRSQGALTWERVQDWTLPGRMPARGQRGGGLTDPDGEPDERSDDRKEDLAAARYHDELATLTRRVEADTARIRRIIAICNPDRPKNLANRDLLLAQVAADGWCISCWRDDQNLTPVTMQPARGSRDKGTPYYRDLCRACGSWKAEHGQLPPMEILVLRHSGRRVTTADADRALAKMGGT